MICAVLRSTILSGSISDEHLGSKHISIRKSLFRNGGVQSLICPFYCVQDKYRGVLSFEILSLVSKKINEQTLCPLLIAKHRYNKNYASNNGERERDDVKEEEGLLKLSFSSSSSAPLFLLIVVTSRRCIGKLFDTSTIPSCVLSDVRAG